MVVGAENAGLVAQQSSDAMGEEVGSHVGIHCSQGIVQQVHCLVLHPPYIQHLTFPEHEYKHYSGHLAVKFSE